MGSFHSRQSSFEGPPNQLRLSERNLLLDIDSVEKGLSFEVPPQHQSKADETKVASPLSQVSPRPLEFVPSDILIPTQPAARAKHPPADPCPKSIQIQIEAATVSVCLCGAHCKRKIATVGDLLEEARRFYEQFILQKQRENPAEEELRTRSSTNQASKFRRKVLCALASENCNENVDFLLTQTQRDVSFLRHEQSLFAVFARQARAKRAKVGLQDF